jgi:hypothetical protein
MERQLVVDSYKLVGVMVVLCCFICVISEHVVCTRPTRVLNEIKDFILSTNAHPYHIEIELSSEYCHPQTYRYINKNAYLFLNKKHLCMIWHSEKDIGMFTHSFASEYEFFWYDRGCRARVTLRETGVPCIKNPTRFGIWTVLMKNATIDIDYEWLAERNAHQWIGYENDM